MQLSENEIECIKFFPRSENLLSIYLFLFSKSFGSFLLYD